MNSTPTFARIERPGEVDATEAQLAAEASLALACEQELAKMGGRDVKKLVSRLQAASRPEAELHARVLRPWGSYETIAEGLRFQVKRIIVKPGAKLSLQMHHHRAEHWIVVCGTARVTRDEESFLLTENESTYIPLGTRHRLDNPGHVPLELIEVQSGSYLGEDDIVRFEDVYGRAAEVASK